MGNSCQTLPCDRSLSLKASVWIDYVNNVKNYVPINALTAVGALMTLKDFTQSNGRRFYSSMENPLAVKGLTTSKTMSPALTAVGALMTL